MAADLSNDGYFLTGQELSAIRKREYHYNAWSDTLLDAYMQPFWRHVVSYVPKHVAPSTLSACGLVCNIIATCVTVYFAPGFTEPLPSWVSVVNAISIFLYQTFDGIDGKQCFRTQDSEAEEYPDHSVDSVSVVLNAVLLGAVLQLGDSPLLLGANYFFALSAFFAAHWAGHRTRSLVFGRVDVTEAQWSMIAIHLATAVGGPRFWETALVQSPLITFKLLVCCGSILVLLSASVGSLAVAMGLRETPLEANGIHIPKSEFSPWPAVTYLIIMSSFLLCSQSGLLTLLPVPTMLVAGLTLSKAGARLILHKLAMKDGNILDPAAASLLVLYAIKQWTTRPENWSIAAWMLVGALAIDVAIFHVHAFSDLKRARGINIFQMGEVPDGSRIKAKGFYVAGGNFTAVQEAWKEFESDKAKLAMTYPVST